MALKRESFLWYPFSLIIKKARREREDVIQMEAYFYVLWILP